MSFSLYKCHFLQGLEIPLLRLMKDTSFPHSDLRHEEVPAMWSDFYILLKFKFATDVFTVNIWGRMNNIKLELKGPNFDV